MDPKTFQNLRQTLFNEAMALSDRKSKDYAQPFDVLSNFKSAERFGLQPRQVLGNYMFKHIDALERYIRDGSLESEPLDERIKDIINYLVLLHALVAEQRAGVTPLSQSQAAPSVTPGTPGCKHCSAPIGTPHSTSCAIYGMTIAARDPLA